MIQPKFVVFAILVAAIASLMIGGGSTVIEQIVKAQNMTTNMTDSTGNMSQADGNGSISGFKPWPRSP